MWLWLPASGQEQPDTVVVISDEITSVEVQTDAEERKPGILKSEEWSVTFQKVFWSIVLFLLAWIFLKYLARTLERVAERTPRYRLVFKGLIPVIRILTWIGVLYFIIANVIAPPWATLITLFASAGIAIGFASQDILKNIFGGIMILFDRPFQVGDKVEIGKYYGEITDIGLRTVRLVTPDDSRVTVPNNEIVNTAVSNANSGESNCQVVAEFYLPIHSDLPKVKKIALRAAAVSRYVFLKKPVAVIFLNDYVMRKPVIKMRLKAYVLDVRHEFPFRSEMTERVIAELQRIGLYGTTGLPATDEKK